VIPTKIEVEATEAREVLARLVEANANLRPLMQSIAGFMRDRVEENFQSEGRPKWTPLSPVTVERRGSAHPILQRTGRLAANIAQAFDDTSATVGSNTEYARVMQEGAKQGAFGESRRGGPIPWGDIPARPFLILTEEDQGEKGLLGLVIDYEKNAGA
jgi:phage virion morphogenesis protein